MKSDSRSRRETSILQRKRDKGWLNGRFRELENIRCDGNNKINKHTLYKRAGKGRRQANNITKSNK